MKTRAVLEGDRWVLNGRKIWILERAALISHRHGPCRR